MAKGTRSLGYLLLSLPLATLACGKTLPSAAQVSAAVVGPSLNATLNAFNRIATTPAFGKQLTETAASNWTSSYAAAVAKVNDRPFSIGGHSFSRLHEGMIKSEGAIQQRAATYGSVGAYWKAIGFDAHAGVSAAELNDGLALASANLAQWLNPGTAKISAPSLDDQRLVAKVQLVSLALQQLASESSKSLGLSSGSDDLCYVYPSSCENLLVPAAGEQHGDTRQVAHAVSQKCMTPGTEFSSTPVGANSIPVQGGADNKAQFARSGLDSRLPGCVVRSPSQGGAVTY